MRRGNSAGEPDQAASRLTVIFSASGRTGAMALPDYEATLGFEFYAAH
ncbi:MAG: hypothetical protein KGN79_01035 [Acidobacteriota bacterium]|nr:hypothetical protein [Acidobacteriota bacterium]